TEVLNKARRGEWDRELLKTKQIPALLAAIVERAMATDPSTRFATAEEFAGQLERFARPRSNYWIMTACAVVIAAILAVGGWQVFKTASTPEQPPPGTLPAGDRHKVAETKQLPFSLQVRVGRGKRYVDLLECAPVKHGEEVRFQTIAPAGLHASLFSRGNSG